MTNSSIPFIRTQVGRLPLLLVPRAGSGLIASQLYTRRGSADEAPDESGLASFTASMLKRGSKTRASAEVAFELESLGAMTSHGAGIEMAFASVRSAAPDFHEALAILFDLLRNPAFDAGELEIERDAVLSHLKRLEDEKFEVTYRAYIRRIFAGHGYAQFPEGDPDDVRAITPEKCRAWHARQYRPGNMLFVAAGDFDPEQFTGMLEPLVADWNETGESAARYSEAFDLTGEDEEETLERPDLEQGFVVFGFRVPSPTHADYLALRIGCAALGEGFAGRLFTHLRDERSLAYAVGSALRSHRLGGHMMLYIGTQPDRLDEAREGLAAEAEHLRQNKLSDDDMRRAFNYVAGKFVMGHQSLSSRVGHLAQWEDLGLGAEYDERYIDDLRRVTADQVLEAARRWWVRPTIVTLRPESPKD